MADASVFRSPDDVTQLLHAFSRGDRSAFDRVVELVYDEMRRLARHRLRAEQAGHTLDTGALVHETWLRLVDQQRAEWRSRDHFLAVASEAMRRILVDHARARLAAKRGEGDVPLALDEAVAVTTDADGLLAADDADVLVALDAALRELATFNADGARVVQYRFFGGLSHAEIAHVTGRSERTVRRSWTVARAWLHRRLRVGDRVPPATQVSAS